MLYRILHGNNLVGPIPNEIGKLKYLKVLDLGKNQLSGPIPPQLGNLTSLVKMYMEFDILFLQVCLCLVLFCFRFFTFCLFVLQKSSVQWVDGKATSRARQFEVP